MADNVINVRIKDRIDTESNWSSKNPTPLKGERCITEGTGKYKIGDGKKSWLDLPYYEAMTASDRSKFDSIASGANKTTVDSALSSTSTNPVQNKVVNSALAGKSNTNHTHDLSTMINTLSVGTATPNDDDYYVSQYTGGGTTITSYHRRPLKALFKYIKSKFHKVAVSGSYNDLSNKPTIPTVGNGTITIKQAGVVKGSFTTNQSGATTIELTDNNTNTWRDVVDNLTSTATDKSLSAKQGKLLNDNKAEIREWSAQIKCATWSRLCYVEQKVGVIGSSFILNISGTRYNVVYNDTFVIKVHHPQKATISKISGSTYSTGIQIRVVSDSSGKCYVEMYENVNGATNTTDQTVYCSLIDIACGVITTYTSFTNGASIPTGFTSNATITTNSNSLQGNLTWGEITGKPSTFTPSSHTHDDRYYTESEVDSKLSRKANSSHNHTISQITDIANASVKSATSATTAASAQSVEWNNVKNKPSTYTPSSHSHDNSTITSLDAGKITTGTINIARLPQGALERCVIVADDTARFKLTKSNIQKGDTVKVTGTGKMYFVIDDTKLTSEDGYTVYTAGSATAVPWSGITGKPATYPPSSHNHDNSYLKLTGGTLSGALNISGTAASKPLRARGIVGSDGNGSDGELHLQFGANNVIKLGNEAAYSISADGGTYTGKANTAGTADIAKVANSVTWANVSGKPSTFTPASHTHNYAGSSSAGGSAWSSNAVNNIFGSSRQTSGNIDFTNSAYVNKVTYTLATSGMTTGKPPTDGHMLSFGWDTDAGWGAQMSIGDGSSTHMYLRGADSKNNKCVYGDWKTVLDSTNYTTYAPSKTGWGASGSWGINVTGNAATATKLSSSAGSATRPVYFNDGKPVAGTYTLGDACAKGVTNITTAGTLGWTSSTENAKTVPTLNTIAYWNGAFSNTNSNLAYCNKGAFGTAATKNIGDFATAGHNHDSTYLKLSGGTVTGDASFTKGTASTSMTTGTVKVTGGVGVTGRVSAKEVSLGDGAVISYNSTNKCIDFTFN